MMRSDNAPTAGILVADIFVGDYPRIVPNVLRLPKVVRLRVRGSDQRLGHADDDLRFLPPIVHEVSVSLSRESVAHDLEVFLAVEEDRARGIATRAAIRSITERAGRRAALGHTPEMSSSVHARARGPLRIREANPKGGPARGPLRIRAAHPKGGPAPVPSRQSAPPTDTPARRGALGRGAPAQRRVSEASADSGTSEPRRSRWPFPFRVVREPFRVALSGLAFGGIIAGLASLGDLPRVAREVETTARDATDSLTSGVRSLLAADTQAGSSDFSFALSGYQEALHQLTESTTLLQRTVARVDPFGRLTAARTLLSAGVRISELGQEAGGIVRLFQEPVAGGLTDTLEASLPAFRNLEQGLTEVVDTLEGVRTASLPEDIQRVAEPFMESVRMLHRAVAGFVRSHAVVLELLGSTHDRQYLVMFQNSRELRPTGGFIGSFALVDISQCLVRKVHADTIYNPDGQLRDFLVPPRPLRKITDRWFTRDANWFGDFRTSAKKVAHLFERSGGPTVDGVIAVTPAVLEDLLRLTGPISMPSYGVTVRADNVIHETQRLVTYDYDREANTPKAFIADLLPEILARLTTLPRERWGELLERLLNAAQKKHILIYLRDEGAEAAIVHLGWGGALPELPPSSAGTFTDHLGRVEANIGGHKTDDLIDQAVDREVSVTESGDVVATLVVTRRHRGQKSGTPGTDPAEDPARKVNIVYERAYVPFGSELLEARGFTAESAVPTEYSNTAEYADFQRDEELTALESPERSDGSGVFVGAESGFTTFGGWVVTGPEETTVTIIRYRLPFRMPRPSLLQQLTRYELLVTHQPGHLPTPTQTTLRVPDGFRISWAGPEQTVTRSGAQQVTHAAVVDRDRIWGAVIEEK